MTAGFDFALASEVAMFARGKVPAAMREDVAGIVAVAILELARDFDPARMVPWRPWAWSRVVDRVRDEAKSERARRPREAR